MFQDPGERSCGPRVAIAAAIRSSGLIEVPGGSHDPRTLCLQCGAEVRAFLDAR